MYKSNFLVKRFYMLNVAITMTILDLIPHVQFTSFAILLNYRTIFQWHIVFDMQYTEIKQVAKTVL